MHRILLVVLLLTCVGLGCQSLVGPFQRRSQKDRIDDPRLPIEEQEKRGRERLANPEGRDVGPPTGFEAPSVRGSPGRF
jgi:hypothetical protein